MKSVRHRYRCQACATISASWLGRCPGCGAYNTLVEEKLEVVGDGAQRSEPSSQPTPVTAVRQRPLLRSTTYMADVDRVVGGGLVPGALMLVGGDPGIGKSTLLLQIAGAMAADGPVLYVSAEESAEQLSLRAERLGILSDRLYLFAEDRLEAIMAALTEQAWRLVVVDSLQTVRDGQLESAPGSVSQVRAVAAALQHKGARQCPVVMVGHVTKEGSMRPVA